MYHTHPYELPLNPIDIAIFFEVGGGLIDLTVAMPRNSKSGFIIDAVLSTKESEKWWIMVGWKRFFKSQMLLPKLCDDGFKLKPEIQPKNAAILERYGIGYYWWIPQSGFCEPGTGTMDQILKDGGLWLSRVSSMKEGQ